MSGLQIELLGGYRVFLDDRPLTDFATDKVRALLAYLALESDRPHQRTALATLLWPEQDEASARQNLRQTLLRLKQAAPLDDFIKSSRSEITLTPSPGLWLDTATFTRLLERSRQHEHAPDSLCSDCLAALENAVELYRGDFLDQFYLADSLEFEDWVRLKREWIRREALNALSALSETYTRLADYETALSHAWHQLALDPLRESAHRQIMRALALDGRRSEALAQYAACQQTVEAELGVEPEAETTRLYQDILDGAFDTAPSRTYRHNIPAPLTAFIGRDSLRASLTDMLHDPDLRLITLQGQGGVGKTRLALEAARAQLDTFTDGVFFSSLADLNTLDSVIHRIADDLGLTFADGLSVRPQLESFLRDRHVLLVLDNLEHLLTDNASSRVAAQTVTDWLHDLLLGSESLKILITSRVRNNLPGEQVVALSGIDFPPADASDPQILQASEAVRLFFDIARRVRPEMQASGENLTAAAEIARLVEGLPLAIILAASWLEMLTPADILESLRQRQLPDEPGLLVSAEVALDQRHSSLQLVFDHSWDLLDERERDAFTALSIFRGGFDRTSAQHIAGATLRDLSSLLSRSFIQHQAAGGRYEIPQVLREFGTERLATEPERMKDLYTDYAAWFLTFLAEQTIEVKQDGQPALTRLDHDFENIQQAWRTAVDSGRWSLLGDAAQGLALYTDWQVRYTEGLQLFQYASDNLSPSPDTGLATDHLSILFGLASLSRLADQPRLAEQALNAVEGLLTTDLTHHDQLPEFRAQVLLARGHDLQKEGAYRPSIDVFAQALELARPSGDIWLLARIKRALGESVNELGEYAQARRWLESAIEDAREVGSVWLTAGALDLLSAVLRDIGDLPAAEAAAGQAADLYDRLGHKARRAAGLLAQGWVLIYQGRFPEAAEKLGESVTLHEEVGIFPPVDTLCIALVELGRYAELKAHFQTFIPRCRAHNRDRELAQSLGILSNAHLVDQDFELARIALEENIALHTALESQDRLSHAQAFYAQTMRGLGDTDAAWTSLAKCLDYALPNQALVAISFAVPVVALLLLDEGRPADAAAIYQPLAVLPMVAFSQLRQDLTGQELQTGLEGHLDRDDDPPNPDKVFRLIWQSAEAALREAKNHTNRK